MDIDCKETKTKVDLDFCFDKLTVSLREEILYLIKVIVSLAQIHPYAGPPLIMQVRSVWQEACLNVARGYDSAKWLVEVKFEIDQSNDNDRVEIDGGYSLLWSCCCCWSMRAACAAVMLAGAEPFSNGPVLVVPVQATVVIAVVCGCCCCWLLLLLLLLLDDEPVELRAVNSLSFAYVPSSSEFVPG